MINRVILHMNNRVYSFLDPYMRDNTLSTYADNSLIYSEDIKKHNMHKQPIRGRILTWNNYEIIVTAVDFIPRDYYPMKVTTICREEESV